MCGRFRLVCGDDEVAEYFGLPEAPDLPPRFNICPTQEVLAVRWNTSEGRREASMLRWGLVPPWATDLSGAARMINARAETVEAKPAFRAAFRTRRCLVAADGFYEWRHEGKVRTPFVFVMRPPVKLFAFAGLWERWTRGDNAVDTCTILTTTANGVVAPFHDRMPVIVGSDDHGRWLDPATDSGTLKGMLVPCQARLMDVMAADPTSVQPSRQCFQ